MEQLQDQQTAPGSEGALQMQEEIAEEETGLQARTSGKSDAASPQKGSPKTIEWSEERCSLGQAIAQDQVIRPGAVPLPETIEDDGYATQPATWLSQEEGEEEEDDYCYDEQYGGAAEALWGKGKGKKGRRKGKGKGKHKGKPKGSGSSKMPGKGSMTGCSARGSPRRSDAGSLFAKSAARAKGDAKMRR